MNFECKIKNKKTVNNEKKLKKKHTKKIRIITN